MHDAKAALKLLEDEKADLVEKLKKKDEDAKEMKPETAALIRQTEEEKERALAELKRVAEEKVSSEQAKDQALALANDLIERLMKQLVLND